jgi:hypothetical protein
MTDHTRAIANTDGSLLTPAEADELLAAEYVNQYPPPGEDNIVTTDRNRLALVRAQRGNPRAQQAAFAAVGRAARVERETRERTARSAEQNGQMIRRGRGGR